MAKPKFLRSDTVRHARLGKNKRRLQKWRKARGRHSKIRRKHFSYPVQPGIGYKQTAQKAGLIRGKRATHIGSMGDLSSVQKGSAIIISRRIGAKKRIEILKKAHEMNLTAINIKERTHEAR